MLILRVFFCGRIGGPLIMVLFCSLLDVLGTTSVLPNCCNRTVAADALPAIDVFTAGMQREGGFLDIYWDESEGQVFLDVNRFGEDFLCFTALESGLGSNPVGLDRGQLGESIVCRWRRIGRRVYLEQQNLKFRAEGASDAERTAVADSFAPSIQWAGDIVASQDSRCLVNVTSLVVSDRHGISAALESANQGSYLLDDGRSFPIADAFAAFPNNLELSAMLTFSSGTAGKQVRAVAADGNAFSIRQRLSFVRLPGPGFQRRSFDPRVGSFDVAFADYAVPLDKSIFQALMVRHRLERDKDGKIIKPIVYYVDAAAPEPVRSALVEGASWWSDAFDNAGFEGGFRVEVAPEGMDPLDVRFNFIQWVHRQTRGWSYGASVIDPRTGEIIKGHVSLGSLRIRQDRLLTENLLTASPSGPASACGMRLPAAHVALERLMPTLGNLISRDQALEISLARIRQLSAHEVGHTLGIAHNFAASTYMGRASVMDYPAPRIRVNENGEIDASDAYAVGMGAWDMRTVDYMYRAFPDAGKWKAYIDEKLKDDIRDGVLYISDADARPLGGAHPKAHLWDNGIDPIDELEMTLRVRRLAMQKFSANVLLEDEPSGELVRAFTPLYFYHRYQTEAVSKLVGGVNYAYSLPGDANAEAIPVESSVQRKAVAALMKTIEPSELEIEPRIVRLLIPPSMRTAWSNEEPSGYSGPIFDPMAVAETSAAMTVDALLHPERAARLMTHGATIENHSGLNLVLEPLEEFVVRYCKSVTPANLTENNELLEQARIEASKHAIGRRVAGTIVNGMIALTANDQAREDVRAEVRQRLVSVLEEINRLRVDRELANAEASWIVDKINRFLARPDLQVKKISHPEPPPGSPIGVTNPSSIR